MSDTRKDHQSDSTDTTSCALALIDCEHRDVLDMRRRLVFPTSTRGTDGRAIDVEVALHTRFTRASGPLTLGPPIYSTTLLPGEKVRLATTDRRSRFSFDSESQLSHRSEQLSEEQYRMSAFRAVMSDQNSTDNGSTSTTEQGAWDFHGDASGSIGLLSASADANARGSHNASSTADYLREHSAHASLAERTSVEATRTAHAVSVGEVSTRTHQEGESEDHFESASREFANPNQCHALTFVFHRLDKCETTTFELVSIRLRVIDSAAPTPVPGNPLRSVGWIASIPQELPATATARLTAEDRGLQSVALYAKVGLAEQLRQPAPSLISSTSLRIPESPISADDRHTALEEVEKALIEEGLLDQETRDVSERIRKEIGFERETALPTAGVIVRGSLDDCNVCEVDLQRKVHLELERADLQNKLLARQIELLDKAQEYRCCPEPTDPDDD
ncbi:hypothetical protein [Leekyejoonella antrihumi]|uniref:Uncharacterized protein n=1 Tax=Leekyejoonella antrihumi TaxID=1660198 RepID=A0A563E3L9_9MICO|nr:hypothetical protein [Leekyejoonella antrihumi]TWP37118.1 hypothetical protein FGL98_06775 [Leekyejoonella antrihumi]